MHKDDVKAIENFLQGLGWLIRANTSIFFVFVGGALLFPVQLVLWIAGSDSFFNTEPYRYLRFVFMKGTAFDWERPVSKQSYEEWKRNPPQ